MKTGWRGRWRIVRIRFLIPFPCLTLSLLWGAARPLGRSPPGQHRVVQATRGHPEIECLARCRTASISCLGHSTIRRRRASRRQHMRTTARFPFYPPQKFDRIPALAGSSGVDARQWDLDRGAINASGGSSNQNIDGDISTAPEPRLLSYGDGMRVAATAAVVLIHTVPVQPFSPLSGEMIRYFWPGPDGDPMVRPLFFMLSRGHCSWIRPGVRRPWPSTAGASTHRTPWQYGPRSICGGDMRSPEP